MSTGNVRADAANILTILERDKASLSVLLEDHRDHEQYSLLQELAYGCCRWFNLLDALLAWMLDKPLKLKDRDIHWLLIAGLYQLRYLSIPDHAVLNETVTAARSLGKPWAKALLNGVLRNYLRSRDQLETRLEGTDVGIRNSHPRWLVESLSKQWPGQLHEILQANNERPPLTLRVNQQRLGRDEYLQILADKGIGARAGELAESAVYLEKPVPVSEIPGFHRGEVSVQDEASQLVPGLLGLGPGMAVLDACAAPGGKTTHILESEDSLTSCTAIDKDSARLARLAENLERLGLEADLRVADASDVSAWWQGKSFDRILLDAPCTAVGVIRRHPDIKLLRDPSSLESQPKLQRQLLTSLWPTLASGGLFLYTTCSLLREENEGIIEAFLTETDNVKYESIVAEWGVECAYGRQLLPAKGIGTDGFYFCLLRKT